MGNPSKRVEIHSQLAPTRGEAALLDNHSLLNLFNVLERQLEGLDALLPRRRLKPYADFCVEILLELSGDNLSAKIPAILERIADLEAFLQGLVETRHEHLDFFRAILETLEVARVRLGEFQQDRLTWRPVSHGDFRIILNQFLSATERVGRGKFRFVYPPEQPGPLSYRIDFRIQPDNTHLEAPLILHDTIRDLVGNARKYSMPGTCINIELEQIQPAGIRLSVSDQGIGIPAGEIENVVEYGYRASNAADRATMGGGYGLTKAYLLSRKFNGRFFIDSAEGKGTTIELFLYRPS